MYREIPTLNEINAAAQGRRFLAAPTAWNVEARTVELAFSSEYAEGERPYGIEILDHSPGACNLDRLRDSGAVLVNHDQGDQIGVVVSVYIGADRIGRATVRFGKSARASEIFDDVVSGIRKHVSVGYRALDFKHQETRSDGVEVYLVTSWQPYEISIVPVPFDPTVGVGRNLNSTTMPHLATDPALLGNLERTLVGLRAAPVPPIAPRRALATGLTQARMAVVQPGATSNVAGAMVYMALSDVMTAQAPNPNRVYPLSVVSRPAGEMYTIRAAVLEASRVVQAGAILVPVKDAPEPVKDAADLLAFYKREARFAVVKPAAFGAVADGANVGVTARPVASADIDLGEAASHAVRFSISRDEQKNMGEDALEFEIQRSIAAGLAQLADKVLLQAIAAKNPAAFSLAAAAAAGVRFGELRAIVGTAGTGASVNAAGTLVAAGLVAELSDQASPTLAGVFSRTALACEEEIRVVIERRGLMGELNVTVFTSMQALIPDATVFWKVAA